MQKRKKDLEDKTKDPLIQYYLDKETYTRQDYQNLGYTLLGDLKKKIIKKVLFWKKQEQ